MIFTTIEPAPGLSTTDRRRVARSGPSAVLTRTSYPSLLASAHFVEIEHTDITADYRTTQQAWIDATRRRAQAIGAAMGEALSSDGSPTGRTPSPRSTTGCCADPGTPQSARGDGAIGPWTRRYADR